MKNRNVVLLAAALAAVLVVQYLCFAMLADAILYAGSDVKDGLSDIAVQILNK